MITGFDTDVQYRSETHHVQPEDGDGITRPMEAQRKTIMGAGLPLDEIVLVDLAARAAPKEA